jgi:UDP-N-acetylglucosamine--N-acetylmuramyl-(pentapeptide) pyrophosphoryl-undecaprenol N-acetylglucosamine transferase
MSRPLILITAGGTGGHLFPAEALATLLLRIGYRVVLATDPRVGRFAENFPADAIFTIPSATPSVRHPWKLLKAVLLLAYGVCKSLVMVHKLKPALVVSFGGYPTVPPALAASLFKVPLIIHEQNGVMGRANRFLAKKASVIATGVAQVRGIPETTATQIMTGNPLRPAVIEAAHIPYPEVLRGGKLRILVFGGSQGASIMADIVPAAIARLRKEHLPRLVLTQQAREEDSLKVRAQYLRSIGPCEVQPFFKDLPKRIADSHLVIARSGASTVAELAAIGRPSILVPLAISLDQDQTANAAPLAEVGAALVIPQEEFTAERLAVEITLRLTNGALLTEAATAAKTLAQSEGSERLAALVVKMAGLPKPDLPKPDPQGKIG